MSIHDPRDNLDNCPLLSSLELELIVSCFGGLPTNILLKQVKQDHDLFEQDDRQNMTLLIPVLAKTKAYNSQDYVS